MMSSIDKKLSGFNDIALLIGRILIGVLFLIAAYNKFKGLGGTTGYFTKLGIPAMQDYFKNRYGMGQETGIDLPSERIWCGPLPKLPPGNCGIGGDRPLETVLPSADAGKTLGSQDQTVPADLIPWRVSSLPIPTPSIVT